MRRRNFIAGIAGSAVAWPLVARAQQPAMPVIGSLYSVSAAAWVDNMVGFRRGLGETGFVDGRNVAIEYRWADGQLDRMPAMTSDLIGRKVSVILTGGNDIGVRQVIAATQTIPIVFTTSVDPVSTGLVASLNRPGGNATGVSIIGGELAAKQLELLHELIPSVTRIAVMADPRSPVMSQAVVQNAQSAARRLGLDVIVVNATNENEIETAFAAAVQQGAGALFADEAYFTSRREQIAALGLRHKLPTFGVPQTVAAGTLMGYGANIPDSYRQAGVYVGRILKGEKPGDLPVMQPTKFVLVINLKTAKALGLTIPQSLLIRADEVIE
jgi:putative tryptophan/tyrosine transport system substrate-binding protein